MSVDKMAVLQAMDYVPELRMEPGDFLIFQPGEEEDFLFLTSHKIWAPQYGALLAALGDFRFSWSNLDLTPTAIDRMVRRDLGARIGLGPLPGGPYLRLMD